MSKELICSACGSIGKPKTVVRGNIFTEMILWLCFLLPGLIYSIWRLSTRHQTCRQCGSSALIPLDSPRGKQLAKEFAV